MPAERLLQSWKEISNYVGRTERTVQRWEQAFGFPVHRPSGKARSAVMALTKEIQEWTRGRPSVFQIRRTPRLNRTELMPNISGEYKPVSPQNGSLHPISVPDSSENSLDAAFEARLLHSSLVQEQRMLRESVAESRKEQRILLQKLKKILSTTSLQ